MFLAGATAHAAVYYVDGDSPNDGPGNDWEHAFHYLQNVLAVAGSGDEIHVAEGTYRPDEDLTNPDGTGDREGTFQLTTGVPIYGGYAGYGQPDPDERDTIAHETILSGDLAENDGPDPFENNDENSYHVVTGSGTEAPAILDGFTITAGNGDGVFPHTRGAGMYSDNWGATLANCTLSGNSATSYGGGMHNSGGNPTLIDCTFSGNSAGLGGGMGINGGSATLVNCTFSGNSADLGGGLYDQSTLGSPTLTNCTFVENSAYGGGGMHKDYGRPRLTNCAFTGNSAQNAGGGMCSWDSDPTLTNCSFSGNSSQNEGGGMHSWDSRPRLANCAFTGNSAGHYSGGMHIVSCQAWVSNCTFTGNSAPNGSALACDTNSSGDPNNLDLANSILWDGEDGIWSDEVSAITITYSDVQGGWPGEGNIDADPVFVDADGADDVPGTEDDDLHLALGSPCIDMGDPDFTPEPGERDMDGEPRVFGDWVDMGADEYHDCNGNATVDYLDIASGTSADCNSNNVPDECGRPGDIDGDFDVDLTDFATFVLCYAGAAVTVPPTGCGEDQFCSSDIDGDGDVDLSDFATFALNYTGAQ